MERKLIFTEDGSHSFFVPELDEQYHSIHGAIQESEHVFIQSGLNWCEREKIIVFEVGFGTGLNALLTLLFASQKNKEITYISVEKYPLIQSEYEILNYATKIAPDKADQFQNLHHCPWNIPVVINDNFILHKISNDLRNINFLSLPLFDVIFFDAFAPNKQPDLWNHEVFSNIYIHSSDNAILVTYCAKGIIRRDLQKVGFKVERIPGPPGKKEMLRAIK
jgi:tRNA U34 5-methylaminomethyl-2-thiouridine-forming methyltransferase MnmC